VPELVPVGLANITALHQATTKSSPQRLSDSSTAPWGSATSTSASRSAAVFPAPLGWTTRSQRMCEARLPSTSTWSKLRNLKTGFTAAAPPPAVLTPLVGRDTRRSVTLQMGTAIRDCHADGCDANRRGNGMTINIFIHKFPVLKHKQRLLIESVAEFAQEKHHFSVNPSLLRKESKFAQEKTFFRTFYCKIKMYVLYV
jgi:hypothetical protein